MNAGRMSRLPPPTLHLSIDNDLSEIGRIAMIIEHFCADRNLGDGIAHPINLALDELLTNTISYGYDDGARHTIRIVLVASEDRVTMTIRDDARPFNPIEVADPDLDAGLDDRPIGGLGIHIVRTMMDEMTYRHVDGQNELTLIKRLEA
jgi:anti-sigma regulatory factor (Ser/Thr protein kinase)